MNLPPIVQAFFNVKLGIVICLHGGLIVVLACGVDQYATPWDELDAEDFDQRPGVIQVRRWVRILIVIGLIVVGVGSIAVVGGLLR